MLKATTPVAKDLDKTNVWRRGRRRQRKDAVRVDPYRVNIVSESLCDDTINYIAPSLERHRGCDLVDLNPGVGLWSRKLHDQLQPRKHLLLDHDADFYAPYLSSLTSRDNVHLINKSGLVWRDLADTLQEHLPHQQAVAATSADPPQRNDSLLVSVNLSMYPSRSFGSFSSVSIMLLYQFLSSVRMATLFQRYGLVRMLIWVNEEDKRRLVPRATQSRRRSSFEAAMACEYIHEVAGKDVEFESRFFLRDEQSDLESAYMALERMRRSGMTMPRGRETRRYKELAATDPSKFGQQLVGVEPPTWTRPFRVELDQLEHDKEAASADMPRLRMLRSRQKGSERDSQLFLSLLQDHEALTPLAKSSPEEFARGVADWTERLDGLRKNQRDIFETYKETHHLLRQDPPGNLWDRREYEPLATSADEFYPNAPTSLLDIQPQAMHPLLRQYGRDSSRAGDMSDLMLRYWFSHAKTPIRTTMDGLWPGFGDLLEQCPSLLDPAQGGSPWTGTTGGLTARSINAKQWGEIMETWMAWPFRPTYTQLIARLMEDHDEPSDEDEGKSSAMGVIP